MVALLSLVRRWITPALMVLIPCACGPGELTHPSSDEPLIYIVLDPSQPDPLGHRSQYAVVLTAGTPLLAPCRSVQRIEMRRVSDGAPFAWRIQPECGEGAQTDQIHVLGESCCVLPDEAATDSLLAIDIAGGDQLELEIMTEGVLVLGRVVVPDTFTIRTVRLPDGRRAASWPRVRGATGYLVDGAILEDTIRVLPAGQRFFEVVALDANMHKYLADRQTVRAGLDNAVGVFGAVRRSVLNVPN